MLSEEWLPRYRLLESFKVDRNGNTYDRGDYNSSFALRAVKLKTKDVNECSNIRIFVFSSNIRIRFLNLNIRIFYLSPRCASSKFPNEELLTCLERWLIKADNLPS